MHSDFYTAENKTVVIDENGSLHQFYTLTETVSNNRHVRFLGKNDEADNIEWFFKYHGHPLMLQYNIYNGLSISAKDRKDEKVIIRLLEKIKNKKS